MLFLDFNIKVARWFFIVSIQALLFATVINAEAQTGAPCDCSEFTGSCTASVSNVESNSIVDGSWFNHRLDVKTSTTKDQCAFVVLYFPESGSPHVVTVVGGYDHGIWNVDQSSKELTPADFTISSCDICIGKSKSDFEDIPEDSKDDSAVPVDILGLSDDGLDLLDETQLNELKLNRKMVLNDESLVGSQLSDFERGRRLEILKNKERVSNRRLFDDSMATANAVSSALSKNEHNYPSGGIGYGPSSESSLIQECRSKTAHLTRQMGTFKQEYGTITKADALKVIKHNELGIKAANICLQIFPVGSNEYNLTMQGRNTYEAAIADARAHLSSLNTRSSQQSCNRNAYASEMPCPD